MEVAGIASARHHAEEAAHLQRGVGEGVEEDPVLAPVLVGWSGGPPVADLRASGDIEGFAVAELARVFGMRRGSMEKQIDSIHHRDWTVDPYIRGAYGYAGVGGAYAARILARSFDTVFIAGEATDAATGGTVEAALVSGKRAARKFLERSRGQSC